MGIALLFCLAVGAVPRANAEALAKDLFGAQKLPAVAAPKSYGFYSKGCFSGGVAIATDGPTWQAMRVSRNRRWGHPAMIKLIEKLSRGAVADGWPGLLLGDISQPRGGPMLTGHASHQIGLDADIWLTPMPRQRANADERENMPATNMARSDWMDVDPGAWTAGHMQLIRAAASDRRIERILVNPALKVALCREAGANRSWLSKVRPVWGHNYHFHVRMACPAGEPGCAPQGPPGPGDGCGEELQGWLAKQHTAMTAPPKKPRLGPPPKPKPPMSVEALPPECRQVLVAR